MSGSAAAGSGADPAPEASSTAVPAPEETVAPENDTGTPAELPAEQAAVDSAPVDPVESTDAIDTATNDLPSPASADPAMVEGDSAQADTASVEAPAVEQQHGEAEDWTATDSSVSQTPNGPQPGDPADQPPQHLNYTPDESLESAVPEGAGSDIVTVPEDGSVPTDVTTTDVPPVPPVYDADPNEVAQPDMGPAASTPDLTGSEVTDNTVPAPEPAPDAVPEGGVVDGPLNPDTDSGEPVTTPTQDVPQPSFPESEPTPPVSDGSEPVAPGPAQPAPAAADAATVTDTAPEAQPVESQPVESDAATGDTVQPAADVPVMQEMDDSSLTTYSDTDSAPQHAAPEDDSADDLDSLEAGDSVTVTESVVTESDPTLDAIERVTDAELEAIERVTAEGIEKIEEVGRERLERLADGDDVDGEDGL